jgi:hypothetical protein
MLTNFTNPGYNVLPVQLTWGASHQGEAKRRQELQNEIRRAQELRALVAHLKWRLAEAIEQAKANPTSATLRGEVGELIHAYDRYYGELREAIADIKQSAGSEAPAILKAQGLERPIYPKPGQPAEDLKAIETTARQKEQAATQAMPAANNNSGGGEAMVFGAGGHYGNPLVLAAAAEVENLLAIAKNPASTTLDGEILLAAVDQAKAQRREAYQSWKDQRLEALQAQGHDLPTARRMFAQELRQARRDTEEQRGQQIECEGRACRLGSGLVAGTVQQGRADLPIAIAQHHTGKAEKKSAEASRSVWREKMAKGQADATVIENMRAAMAQHSAGSFRMTLGIFRELTAEYMAEGYTREQAQKLARDKFRAVHEARIGMSVEEKTAWRNQAGVGGKLPPLAINPQTMTPEQIEYRQRVNDRIADRALLQGYDKGARSALAQTPPRPVATIRHDATPRAPPGVTEHGHRPRVTLAPAWLTGMGVQVHSR